MHLSRFFTLPELTRSQTATARGIDNQPDGAALQSLTALCQAVLDPLREAAGRAITVNSGYRGPALNRALGGAAKSQHQEGKAADIQAPGLQVLALFQAVIQQNLPFDQLIYEVKSATSKWVHVSHDGAGGRRQILVARFGADGKARYQQISAAEALAMREAVTRSNRPLTYEETADEPEWEAAADAGAAVPARRASATRSPATPTLAAKGPVKPAPAAKAPAKGTRAKKAPARNTPATTVAAKKVAAKTAPRARRAG